MEFSDIPEIKAVNQRWLDAETPTVKYICNQMAFCQENAASRVLIDRTDVGKTTSAKLFARNNDNVGFNDCSQYRTKAQFIRGMAKSIGLSGNGWVKDVRIEVVEHLRHLDQPIIILDEAGFLLKNDNMFMELLSMWNALERRCGWYLMGANSFKKEWQRMLMRDRIGAAENFRRFGSSFQQASPVDDADYVKYFRHQATMIAKVNAPGMELDDLLNMGVQEKGTLSLERLKDNILKARKKAKRA